MSCDILVIHSAEETETESKKNEKNITTTHISLFTVLTAAINVPNVRTHNE